MKSSRLKIGLAVLVFAPAVAFAAPGDGLIGSDHDFASGTGSHTASQTVGLCTFCHTPHKSQSTLLLWNHTLSTNTFTWDVAKTTAGTTFPSIAGGTYKGPTAKCLSCHDGSVAIGDIAWYKESAYSGGTGMSTFKMDAEPSHQVGPGGAMKGNHPVAMPYPYGQAMNTYNGQRTGSGAVLTEWQNDPTTLTQANIRLFNDDGTGNISPGVAAAATGIECSTCHDPHNKAAKDEMFLRGMISGSTQADGYLCLQCHKK